MKKQNLSNFREVVVIGIGAHNCGKFMDPRIYGQETMQETPTGPGGRNEIALEAYEETGIGPEDIDLCEIHDAVAPAELETYSALGLCEPGEEMAYFEEGNTRISGKTPVNTSGGLASRGHPIGATGLLQIYELVLQRIFYRFPHTGRFSTLCTVPMK